jgi:multidrug efflux system membrane fusion protein
MPAIANRLEHLPMPRIRVSITALLSVVAAVMLLLGLTWQRSVAQAPPGGAPQSGSGVPVKVARADNGDLPIYARGIGTVQAWRTVDVRAEVTGYLHAIDFREGQDVKAGDPLAEIDPRPYAAVLAEAQAKKAGDAAALANDQMNYRRDAALAKSDFASQQQVDNDNALVRQFEANVMADDAAIAAAQLNLEFCRITAPIDGVAGFRLIDIGNLVQANGTQPIVTLTQVQPIAVVFTLAQQELPAVRAALAAGKPEVLAYSADDGTQLSSGTLLTPNNTIDTSTGTISLKALFENADRKLWPGQFVDAHLRLRVDHDAVTVPLAAIQHGPDGLYVFVVKADNTVDEPAVTVSYQDSKIAEISKGLSGGETVVTDGQSRLQKGTRDRGGAAAAGRLSPTFLCGQTMGRR